MLFEFKQGRKPETTKKTPNTEQKEQDSCAQSPVRVRDLYHVVERDLHTGLVVRSKILPKHSKTLAVLPFRLQSPVLLLFNWELADRPGTDLLMKVGE